MPRITHPRRTTRIYVRFSPEELTAAQTRAHAAGRALAVYLRELALRGRPKIPAGHESSEVVHHLARAATALRTLSRQDAPARGSGDRSPALIAIQELMPILHRLAVQPERDT